MLPTPSSLPPLEWPYKSRLLACTIGERLLRKDYYSRVSLGGDVVVTSHLTHLQEENATNPMYKSHQEGRIISEEGDTLTSNQQE